MSALRGLQEKIRQLEVDRTQAESNLRTLARETTRYRDILQDEPDATNISTQSANISASARGQWKIMRNMKQSKNLACSRISFFLQLFLILCNVQKNNFFFMVETGFCEDSYGVKETLVVNGNKFVILRLPDHCQFL